MMGDLVQGKGFRGEPPIPLLEYLIAKNTGWTLEYIRKLELTDFDYISSLVKIDENMNYQYQSVRAKTGF